MLYNAAARVLWPGCRLNVTPAGESGDFVMAPYGRAFWLGPGLYAIVDQNRTPATPVVFKDLTEYQWFYRQGMACRAIYDEALGVFKLITMQEMVFGGPCFHRNGNLLDNRRVNLAAPLAEPVAILEAGPRDSAEAETEGSADPRSAR